MEVQFDLLFYRSLLQPKRGLLPIIHLIDVCIRFSRCGIVPSKEEIDLTTGISTLWIAIFGAMQTLMLDEETAMRGQCVMDWASANGIHIKFKAPRQKAWIVERGNALIRDGLHTTESQLLQEGITVTCDHALAVVTFMKNSLTVVNESTPYNALLGRQPLMLPPMEGGHTGQYDSMARIETNSRNEARVREVAMSNIVEGLAKSRVERADRHKTRGAIERQEYAIKDLVDLWFEPGNKDTKGWRGPGSIETINSSEGNLSVRYQGRTLNRTIQELRPHIPYLIYMMLVREDKFQQLIFLME